MVGTTLRCWGQENKQEWHTKHRPIEVGKCASRINELMEEAYCANCFNKDNRWAKIYSNYVRNLLQPQYTAQDSVHKKRASMYFSLYSKDML